MTKPLLLCDVIFFSQGNRKFAGQTRRDKQPDMQSIYYGHLNRLKGLQRTPAPTNYRTDNLVNNSRARRLVSGTLPDTAPRLIVLVEYQPDQPPDGSWPVVGRAYHRLAILARANLGTFSQPK